MLAHVASQRREKQSWPGEVPLGDAASIFSEGSSSSGDIPECLSEGVTVETLDVRIWEDLCDNS